MIKFNECADRAATEGLIERNEAILASGHSVISAEIEALQVIKSGLGDSFVTAVMAILDCPGRVCVTGVGKAGLIGRKVQATFSSVGTAAYFLHPTDALHGDLGMVQPEDIVLAFSKSGSTELVRLLPRLKTRGSLVILITSAPDSEAARLADCVVSMGEITEACPLGVAPSSSTTAMLVLGDAIALTVMRERTVQLQDFAQNHPSGSLGRMLIEVREVMRTQADCPIVTPTASIRQCYEATRRAPRRAGAVLVSDEAQRLLGIVTQGDIARSLIAGGHPDTAVSEVMTRTPKSVRAYDTIAAAQQLMSRHLIDEMPVIDEHGVIVGLLDAQDLIAAGYESGAVLSGSLTPTGQR